MESFGGFLRQLRQRRQLTLGQLTLRSKVNKATLSRWESGTYKPRLPELSLALDALKATPTERAHALELLNVPRAILAERHDSTTTTRLSLGDFLYGLRWRVGKTQEDVARGTQVSRTLYAQWEGDLYRPSDSQLHTVAFVLGASLEELLGLTSGAFASRPVEKSLAPRRSLLYLGCRPPR